jgi:hypothetical protein
MKALAQYFFSAHQTFLVDPDFYLHVAGAGSEPDFCFDHVGLHGPELRIGHSVTHEAGNIYVVTYRLNRG